MFAWPKGQSQVQSCCNDSAVSGSLRSSSSQLASEEKSFLFILTWNILIVYIYENSQNILPLCLVFVVPRFLNHPFFTRNDHSKENPMCLNFYSFASPLFWFWCQKWRSLLGLSRGELSLCPWLHCQQGNLLAQHISPLFQVGWTWRPE